MADPNSQASAGSRQLIFNGLNGTRGGYLLPPMSLKELTDLARNEPLDRNHPLAMLRKRHIRDTEKSLGVIDKVTDPNDLAQAGWGVIFPADISPRMLEALCLALKPLLDLREEQARPVNSSRFQVYTGERGYQAGEEAKDWLARHGASPAEQANPDVVPYYLLLVGSPQEIPFSFQYALDVIYGVGRLHFDRLPHETMAAVLAKYARYAQSVAEAERALERGEGFRARRAVYFGTSNAPGDPTELSATKLVAPLCEQFGTDLPDWKHELVKPDEARHDKLVHLLGDDTPSLLFTATHGMGFELDDNRQDLHQGALVTSEWPGNEAWPRPIPDSFYMSGEDVSGDAHLHGMIAFHFACYGAGTPSLDDFVPHRSGGNRIIARRDMVAQLPQRLLGHDKGGALAVLAHVDRAWDYSFYWGELDKQTSTFHDTLSRLMRGMRVGWATELLNARYAAISSVLTGEMHQIKLGRRPNEEKLVGYWTANNDARSYVVLGDPAVRLPLAKADAVLGQRHDLKFEIPVGLGANLEMEDSAAHTVDATQDSNYRATNEVPSVEAQTPIAGDGQRVSAASLAAFAQGVVAAAQFAASGAAGGDVATGASYNMGGRAFDGQAAWPWERPREAGPEVQSLDATLRDFAGKLGSVLQSAISNLTTLEVSTYVSSEMNNIRFDQNTGEPIGAVTQRARTLMKLDGDTVVVVPEQEGELDEAVWAIHTAMVDRAMTHRTKLIEGAISAAAGLLDVLKR